MRPIRRHLTFANVASGIALFVALTGGTAVALQGSNTVFTDDIANDTQPASGGNPAGGLTAVDLRAGSVGTSEVANGTLNDEDIGQGTFVNFTGAIGNVPGHSCVEKDVSGVNAQGDHLLLTPSFANQHPNLVYSAETTASEQMVIQVCNPTANTINDGNTNFNLLVIDAQ
jgi:uncharacterized iron-regulated membrane protein